MMKSITKWLLIPIISVGSLTMVLATPTPPNLTVTTDAGWVHSSTGAGYFDAPIVPSYGNVVINENAYFYINTNTHIYGNLTIHGTLYSDGSTHTLQVDGNIVIEEGGMITEISNNGTSIITCNGTIEMKRTIPYSGYALVASPFASTSGLSGYAYNEGSRTIGDYRTGWVAASGNYVVGKGYAISDLGTYSLFGTQLNCGNGLSIGTSKSNIDADPSKNGWNLLGNPYPCPLNVTGLLDQSIYPAVYQWNGTNYTSTDGNTWTDWIATGEGFFVQTPSTVTYGFENGDRYGVSRAAQTENVYLTLSGTYTDKTKLKFEDNLNTTDNFDDTRDARKFFTAAVSEIFTVSGENRLAINALVADDQDKTIPVGVTISAVGDYTIAAENNSGYSTLLLKDNVTGALTDISQSAYTFTATSTGTFANRFTLLMSTASVTSVNDGTQSLSVKAYSNNAQNIVVKGNFDMVRVVDTMGNEIYKGTSNSIPVQQAGMYLVEVLSSNSTETVKVMVN